MLHYKNLSLENLKEEVDGVWHFEEWKDIPKYEQIHQASTFGRIKTLERRVRVRNGFRVKKEFICKQGMMWQGYLHVGLGYNRKYKCCRVNVLMGKTFIQYPIPKGSVVHHKNTIVTDNRLLNLEVCTQSQNIKYSFQNGRIPTKPGLGKFGSLNGSSVKVVQLSREGCFIKLWMSIRDVTRETNIPFGGITGVCRGRQNIHYGFKWMYLSDYEKLQPPIAQQAQLNPMNQQAQ